MMACFVCCYKMLLCLGNHISSRQLPFWPAPDLAVTSCGRWLMVAAWDPQTAIHVLNDRGEEVTQLSAETLQIPDDYIRGIHVSAGELHVLTGVSWVGEVRSLLTYEVSTAHCSHPQQLYSNYSWRHSLPYLC